MLLYVLKLIVFQWALNKLLLIPDITMHPGYMSEKPEDYVNQAEFIKQFEEKLSKRHRRFTQNTEMETESNNEVWNSLNNYIIPTIR